MLTVKNEDLDDMVWFLEDQVKLLKKENEKLKNEFFEVHMQLKAARALL